MPSKILLIDDDQVNVKLVETQLTKEGFNVVVAAEGEEGLAKAKDEQPDLIILDVEMPNMNGYTFLTELKKTEQKGIPVIVLTAHEENQPIFKLKGVKDYIVKPVEVDDLIFKIKALTDSIP